MIYIWYCDGLIGHERAYITVLLKQKEKAMLRCSTYANNIGAKQIQ